MHVRPNDVMRRWRGPGDAAVNLPGFDPRRQHREWLGRIVARLHLHRLPVDRRAIEARRRSGLETAEGEPEPLERPREPQGRGLVDTTGWCLRFANMNQAAQERASRQDHGAASERATAGEAHAGHDAVADQQVVDLSFDNVKIFGFADRPLHRLGVKLAIGLGARTAHGRALAAVEDTELNPAQVRGPPHQTVECIDLADQMALAKSTDRRVAGHRTDGGEPMGDQGGPGAHARRRSRGLTARVPAADHDHVEEGHGSYLGPVLPEQPIFNKCFKPVRTSTGLRNGHESNRCFT
jgi:hypothetical protein